MALQKLNKIKQKVLKEVEPSEKEKNELMELFKKIQDYVEGNFNLECRLMGSVAKNTFLKDNTDLDIFILFSKKTNREYLEKKGLEIGKAVFNHFKGIYEIDYAEHPYTKGSINGFRVEIVPCYKLKKGEKIISSVDRTPFHTQWIISHLKEEEQKEVLVLKAFLKGIKIYGSSLKVEGFSGYLCEILIAYFGSFENLIQKAKDWNYKEFIDPENYYNGKLPDNLKKKFKNDSLIVIDPVDKNRNVASVLNQENYSKFVFYSWKFFKNPSIRFFFPKKAKINLRKIKKEIEKRGTLLIIEFEKPKIIEDVLYPQLRRTLKRIVNELEENEFELFESAIYVNKDYVRFLLDFKLDSLPKAVKKEGPEVFRNESHIIQFSSKYKRVWVENKRLVTIVDRKFYNARQLLANFLKDSQRGLENKGIPENIAKAIRNHKIADVELKEKGWLDFLAEFLKVI